MIHVLCGMEEAGREYSVPGVFFLIATEQPTEQHSQLEGVLERCAGKYKEKEKERKKDR